MKVGLFFGTFNPVHNAHFQIARSVLRQKNIDQVWIILSPLSPFKTTQKIIDFDHRIKMLELVFSDNQDILILDVEKSLKTPNFTINTLMHLRDVYPKNQFSIILGADNFQDIHLWKNYQTILDNYHVFIYPREGFQIEPTSTYLIEKKITLLAMRPIPISSSLIRDNINNKDYNSYLNVTVYKYIIDHQLY